MKRTPKNYDGILSPAKTIGQLIEGQQDFFKIKNSAFARDLLETWPEIIGPKMAEWTKALSFTDGVLTVGVRSSTLYGVLCHHEKQNLLVRLQERFPKRGVKNLVFRLS